jgi:hypothetical protein
MRPVRMSTWWSATTTPAKRGIVNQQIDTFDVCNPTCTDLQMSVHAAG